MGQPVLKVQDLRKSFGGLKAIDNLSFVVAEGQIKSIIGPNGAGKTTLFNLITGVFPLTGGTLQFFGKTLNGFKPHDIAQQGISRTFQNLELFPNMNALENVMVGCHLLTSSGIFQAGFRLRAMRKEEKRIREKAREELRFMELEGKADAGATSLPLGEQKLLEIARALATQPRLLLLDEPAAGLNIRETEKLSETILRIRARGITVMLVEHDMTLVMGISDEVLVLNYGKKIAEGLPREIQKNREVVSAYLGEEGEDA